MREVSIRGETIRLGQLLKLVGVIGSGSEVKTFLASEDVRVNGERETRRGRQLHPGDVVQVRDDQLRVAAGEQGADRSLRYRKPGTRWTARDDDAEHMDFRRPAACRDAQPGAGREAS